MNIISTISITLSFFIFFPNSLKSQITIDELSGSSDLIVEAKIVNQSVFLHGDGNIYTMHDLVVYKNFTEDIELDTVQIISAGGELDNGNQSFSHSLRLIYNETAIYFLQHSKVFDKTYVPVFGNNGIIRIHEVRKNKFIGQHGTNVLSNLKRDLYDPIYETTKAINIIRLNEYEIFVKSKNPTDEDCVEYSINDVSISQDMGDGNSNLHFSVNIRSNNPFKLNSATIDINYSSNIGENIVSQSLVNLVNGPSFNNYNYHLVDKEPNVISLNCILKPQAEALEINTYKDNLFSCSVSIKDLNIQDILSFDVNQNDIETTRIENDIIGEIKCNSFEGIDDSLVGSLLTPEITSYSENVYAGTKTLFSIEGVNLLGDQETQFAEVWFTNCFNGPFGMVKPYFSDYKTLTNELIEVYVPSYALDAFSGSNFNTENAGSGIFKIVYRDFNTGDIIDETEENFVEILYGINNRFYELNEENVTLTQPILLQNANNGGYIISYTPEFDTIKDLNGFYFKDAFRRAVDRWCEVTNLNLTIDENAYPNGIYDIVVDYGSINGVFASATTGSFSITDVNCPISLNNGSSNHPEDTEVDVIAKSIITFNKDKPIGTWTAESLQMPPLTSVEATSLHEIGHAHGLTHINIEDELMYYDNKSITINNNTINASKFVQDHSSMLSCSSISAYQHAECTTSVQNFDDNISVSASYYNESIEIFTKDDFDTFEIDIYNINGKFIHKELLDANTLKFTFSNKPPGLYFLIIKTPQGYFSSKILVND